MAMNDQRISKDGAVVYRAELACDGCGAVVGTAEEPLKGPFPEHETGAWGASRFSAKRDARARGATLLDDAGGDGALCAECASARGVIGTEDVQVMEWFAAHSSERTAANPGIRFDAVAVERLVASGALRKLLTGWTLTEAGRTALARHRAAVRRP